MSKRDDSYGDKYLQMYPKLTKWINKCVVCHAKGYKPDMPEHISGEFSVATRHLKRYYTPLAVDEMGFCEQCRKHKSFDN